MTEILEFMKNELGARLTNGSRWLIVSEDTPYQGYRFTVYSRPRYAHVTSLEYTGDDIAEALEVLKGE